MQTGNDTGHRASCGDEGNTFDTVTKDTQFCSFSEDFCVLPVICQLLTKEAGSKVFARDAKRVPKVTGILPQHNKMC